LQRVPYGKRTESAGKLLSASTVPQFLRKRSTPAEYAAGAGLTTTPLGGIMATTEDTTAPETADDRPVITVLVGDQCDAIYGIYGIAGMEVLQ
jgi:hypothetical protein